MRIVDTSNAIAGRNSIVAYILRNFGENAVRNFRAAYKEARQQVLKHPNSGAIDWNLSTNQVLYRYVVIGNLSKMLYRIDGDVIYVIDFWDTRREPPMIINL